MLFLCFILGWDGTCAQPLDPVTLFLDFQHFFRSVFLQELARFLETLVGELVEGDVLAGGYCCAPSSGTDGVAAVSCEESALGRGCVDAVCEEVWVG